MSKGQAFNEALLLNPLVAIVHCSWIDVTNAIISLATSNNKFITQPWQVLETNRLILMVTFFNFDPFSGIVHCVKMMHHR